MVLLDTVPQGSRHDCSDSPSGLSQDFECGLRPVELQLQLAGNTDWRMT
jgi:hypothetical protein